MPFLLVLLVLLLVGAGRAMRAPGPALGSYAGTSPAEFVAWLAPAATHNNRTTGIPASVAIAQAAVESAWGRSDLARLHNNLFGVKAFASWLGPVVSATTLEQRADGSWYTVRGDWRVYSSVIAARAAGADLSGLFRVYRSPSESLADHARVLYNGRYAAALAVRHDSKAFAHALTGVYATDLLYGSKLTATMDARNLYAFDAPVEAWTLEPSIVPMEWRV